MATEDIENVRMRGSMAIIRPTLRDVAERAGVSEMTASRVLRGLGEASEETIHRVQSVADTLGYVPHRIASSLSSRNVDLIGVVVPSISSMVFSDVLSGISETASTADKQVAISVSGYDLATEERAVREMLSWRPTGLIVAGLEHTDATRNYMKNSGIPTVEIMDVDGDPVDMNVGISHSKVGRDAARIIQSRGIRKIGFVGTGMPNDFRAAKRLSGFKEELGRQGIPLVAEEFYSGSSSLWLGKSLTERVLTRHPEIECLYFSSDVLSCGAVLYCLEAGRAVPDDLAIAGFNGLDIRLAMPVIPATSHAFRRECGTKAAELILEASSEKVIEFQSEFDPGDFFLTLRLDGR